LLEEVRNTIYEHAVRGEIVSYSTSGRLYGCKGNSIFALTQTCRQIRHEARSVFYSQVTFDFGHDVFLPNTMARPGMKVMQAVQSITVDWTLLSDMNQLLFFNQLRCLGGCDPKHLAKLSSLKHFHVDVPSSTKRSLRFESFTGYMEGMAMDVQLHVHKTTG
jgi:hypothetical protein